MKFNKITKRAYVHSIITVFLLGWLLFLSMQNNKLKDQVKKSQNQLETSEILNNNFKSLLSYYEYLVKIDDVLLESINEEYPIDKDSLKAMFLDFPKDLFDDAIEFRIKYILSINESIKLKNLKIQNSLLKVRNLMIDYNKLEEIHKNLHAHKVELKSKYLFLNNLNQSLSTQIDSLRLRNIDNLKIIELSIKGNSVYFVGERENGKPNGYGVGLWSTGGFYKGEWKNGNRDGYGIYIWKDGDTYEGEWLNGMRTGSGKYIWKDKYSYLGEWLENKRHGFGSIYYPNGKLEYEGIWEFDKFKGKKEK
jgi:hypothetical protein